MFFSISLFCNIQTFCWKLSKDRISNLTICTTCTFRRVTRSTTDMFSLQIFILVGIQFPALSHVFSLERSTTCGAFIPTGYHPISLIILSPEIAKAIKLLNRKNINHFLWKNNQTGLWLTITDVADVGWMLLELIHCCPADLWIILLIDWLLCSVVLEMTFILIGIFETSKAYDRFMPFITVIRPQDQVWMVEAPKICENICTESKRAANIQIITTSQPIIFHPTNKTAWSLRRLIKGCGEWLRSWETQSTSDQL